VKTKQQIYNISMLHSVVTIMSRTKAQIKHKNLHLGQDVNEQILYG